MISHSNCRSALGLTGLLYLQEGPHVCVYTGSNGACNVRYHHVVVVMKKNTQISINVLFMADLIFNAPTKVYSLISFIKKGEELCFFHTVFFIPCCRETLAAHWSVTSTVYGNWSVPLPGVSRTAPPPAPQSTPACPTTCPGSVPTQTLCKPDIYCSML